MVAIIAPPNPPTSRRMGMRMAVSMEVCWTQLDRCPTMLTSIRWLPLLLVRGSHQPKAHDRTLLSSTTSSIFRLSSTACNRFVLFIVCVFNWLPVCRSGCSSACPLLLVTATQSAHLPDSRLLQWPAGLHSWAVLPFALFVTFIWRWAAFVLHG